MLTLLFILGFTVGCIILITKSIRKSVKKSRARRGRWQDMHGYWHIPTCPGNCEGTCGTEVSS